MHVQSLEEDEEHPHDVDPFYQGDGDEYDSQHYVQICIIHKNEGSYSEIREMVCNIHHEKDKKAAIKNVDVYESFSMVQLLDADADHGRNPE